MKRPSRAQLQIKQGEKGEILEFIGVLTFTFFVVTWYLGGGLIGWSQLVADLASIVAVEQATVLRGENSYAPQIGGAVFFDTTSAISGSAASAAIGMPRIEAIPLQRMVQVSVNGGVDWNYGPLQGGYSYGGGGAGRIHNFFPGPPDPWE